MKTKKDALVYYTQTVPADALLDYIKAKNSDSGKKTISVLSIILSAMIRLAPEFSQIGTFLVGKRFYRREDITFSFVMKSSFEGPGKTALVKVRFSGKEKLYDVVDIIDTYKERVKKLSDDTAESSDDILKFFFKAPPFMRPVIFGIFRLLNWMNCLPKKVIDSDPFFTACFIANVGSLGLNAPYHHLYEWGTCSLFMAIGTAYEAPFKDKNSEISFRRVIDINYTLDERVSCSRFPYEALNSFRHYLEHPNELE